MIIIIAANVGTAASLVIVCFLKISVTLRWLAALYHLRATIQLTYSAVGLQPALFQPFTRYETAGFKQSLG
jgi:hypothetical protein